MKNKFWEFKNISDDEAELMLYGEIASEESWWSDVITPKQFIKDLKALGEKSNITVRVNSGGGDVFAANAIYTQLKDNSAKITVKIDGIAASAATIIAMAADDIQIPANGMMMIHDPMFGLCGYYNSEEMSKLIDTLESVKNTIIATYSAKTGKTKDELSDLMKEETWMTGQEAIDEGFADTLMFDETVDAVMKGSMLIVNNISHDLSKLGIKSPIQNYKPVKINSAVQEVVKLQPDVNTKNKQKEDISMKIENIKTTADLKNAFPKLASEIEATAKEEGVKNECARLKAIDEIAFGMDMQLVQDAKYGENPIDAGKLAIAARKADIKKGKEYLNNAENDITASGALEVGANPATGITDDADKQAQEESIANAMANGMNKRRVK